MKSVCIYLRGGHKIEGFVDFDKTKVSLKRIGSFPVTNGGNMTLVYGEEIVAYTIYDT